MNAASLKSNVIFRRGVAAMRAAQPAAGDVGDAGTHSKQPSAAKTCTSPSQGKRAVAGPDASRDRGSGRRGRESTAEDTHADESEKRSRKMAKKEKKLEEAWACGEEFSEHLGLGVRSAKTTSSRLLAMATELLDDKCFPKRKALGSKQLQHQKKQLEYILLKSRACNNSDSRQSLQNVLVQAKRELLIPLTGKPQVHKALGLFLDELQIPVCDRMEAWKKELVNDQAKVQEAAKLYPLPAGEFDCKGGQDHFIALIKATPGQEEAVQLLEKMEIKYGCRIFRAGVSSAGIDYEVRTNVASLNTNVASSQDESSLSEYECSLFPDGQT